MKLDLKGLSHLVGKGGKYQKRQKPRAQTAAKQKQAAELNFAALAAQNLTAAVNKKSKPCFCSWKMVMLFMRFCSRKWYMLFNMYLHSMN